MKTLREYFQQLLLEAVNYNDMLKLDKMYAARKSSTIEPAQEEEQKAALEKFVQAQIEWATKTLKKHHRIVWYLRLVRVMLTYNVLGRHAANESAMELIKKSGIETGDVNGNASDLVSEVASTQNLMHLQGRLSHFLDLNIPAINNMPFEYELPGTLLAKLRIAEKEYFGDTEGLIANDDPEEKNDEVLVQYENGWQWVDLKRTSCGDKQRKSMSDCATTSGKTLVVLREPKKIKDKLFWKQHLRFEINRNDTIGQSKGYANSKPKAEFHKYIVDLLTQKKLPIKGVKSGKGHRPETDFYMKDLTVQDREKVSELNPSFAKLIKSGDAWSIIYNWAVNQGFEVEKLMKDEYGEDFKNKPIILEKTENIWGVLKAVGYRKSRLNQMEDYVGNEWSDEDGYYTNRDAINVIESLLDKTPHWDREKNFQADLLDFFGYDDEYDWDELKDKLEEEEDLLEMIVSSMNSDYHYNVCQNFDILASSEIYKVFNDSYISVHENSADGYEIKQDQYEIEREAKYYFVVEEIEEAAEELRSGEENGTLPEHTGSVEAIVAEKMFATKESYTPDLLDGDHGYDRDDESIYNIFDTWLEQQKKWPNKWQSKQKQDVGAVYHRDQIPLDLKDKK